MEVKIKDAISASILGIEEAIWALQELIDDENDFSETEYYDTITAKELSQSARDMCVSILKSYTERKKRKGK